MTAPDVLSVEHLCKSFGALKAVDDVSFRVAAGEILGLVGPNGAGKTTTINMVLGVLAPTSGRIEVEGVDLKADRSRALSRTNFAAVYAPLPGNLTVEQNLRLGATALSDRRRIPFLLDRVYTLFPPLAERRRQRAGTLSGGERQMLALGRALMSEPKLLLLDEPSLGLGPMVVETLYDTLERLHKEGLTLLLAEQSVQLALEFAEYAYVLQTGRTVLEGPARQLENDPQVQKVYLGIASGTGVVGGPK
jgi:branched-chain amino acid transport system ATP-binding protein